MAADDVELVVPMTPEEKQAIEESAAKLGMNTSEYVRTLFSECAEILEHRDEIEALCDAIEKESPAILADLDKTDAEIQKTIDTLNSIRNHT